MLSQYNKIRNCENATNGQAKGEETMNKETIGILNTIAQENFKKAQDMLEGINLLLNTRYEFLNKRVVFFDEPDAPTCIKYKHAHDAWANAEE